MSRESEDRERDRFASDTDRWSPWAALIGVGSFLLIPVWRLLSWLIGVCVQLVVAGLVTMIFRV